MSKKQPNTNPVDQQNLPGTDRDDTRKESGDKPCSGDKPHC